MAEQSAVNRSVVGSSPIASASGPLEKWLNSHAFHACIHGFESRTGHQIGIFIDSIIYVNREEKLNINKIHVEL